MPATIHVDENLYQYCTPRQREILESIDRLGSARAASIELGMNVGGASETYITVKKKPRRLAILQSMTLRGLSHMDMSPRGCPLIITPKASRRASGSKHH